MSGCKILFLAVFWAILAGSAARAQYEWTSLQGPYWVSGTDVAYGVNGGDQDWHRYLIASNADDSIYYWRAIDSRWNWSRALHNADKLISYKLENNGHIAFCSAYEDDIWFTLDGGVSWNPMEFDEANKRFSSIEVPNQVPEGFNPSDIVMVATEAQQGVVSTYYTENGGTSWHPIGANSTIGWQVNDIEAMMAPVYPPYMAIGTSDGIWRNMTTTWDDPWEPAAFGGLNVPVLESVRTGHGHFMTAAVEEGQDGRCNLYYTTSDHPWSSYTEIRPGNEPFDRVVKDMAAIFWAGSYNISCYVATTEGLYLITFPESDPSQAELMDLATLCPAMSDDSAFTCVDYTLKSGADADSAWVLAGSHHSVYEITEVRDNKKHSMISIDAKEAVEGTYYIGPDDGEPVKAGQ